MLLNLSGDAVLEGITLVLGGEHRTVVLDDADGGGNNATLGIARQRQAGCVGPAPAPGEGRQDGQIGVVDAQDDCTALAGGVAGEHGQLGDGAHIDRGRVACHRC